MFHVVLNFNQFIHNKPPVLPEDDEGAKTCVMRKEGPYALETSAFIALVIDGAIWACP